MLLALLFATVQQPSAPPVPLVRVLVVVAPAEWQEDLKPFVQARQSQLRVEFASLEDIAAEPGVDPPEQIKRYLWRAWNKRSAAYALLVGDADTVPVRFMTLDRETEAAFHFAFYASDLYYADVADASGAFDSWNASADSYHSGYFGEVRGEHNKEGPINHDRVSYVPELAVGRWPVSTREELRRVIDKTLAWSRMPRTTRCLIVHCDGWVDARDRAGAMGDALAARGFSVERQLYGSEASVPTEASVLKALVAGADLALHMGHGTRTDWAGALSSPRLDELARASVMMSVGCSTAHVCNEPPYESYLDVEGALHRGTNFGETFAAPPPPPYWFQPGRLNSTGLGESLVRQPTGGAVAYIGCVTGSQPCAITLMEGFVASLAQPGPRRVGDAWREALAHYYEREQLATLAPTADWYPPSIFFQGMKFALLGDPTLVLTGQ